MIVLLVPALSCCSADLTVLCERTGSAQSAAQCMSLWQLNHPMWGFSIISVSDRNKVQ